MGLSRKDIIKRTKDDVILMFNSLCLIVKIAEIIPSDQTVPNPVNVWLTIH